MTRSSIHIRPMFAQDLDAVRGILSHSEDSPRWSGATFASLLDSPATRLSLVAETIDPRPAVVAAAIVSTATADWELENIAVSAAYQRKGIAGALLREMMALAKSSLAERLLLEVRDSNTAARRLYEKNGFIAIARRAEYYSSPVEDAIIYERGLK